MATATLEAAKDEVLKRDIPWETYMTAKLITATGFQLLRRYDHRSKEMQAGLLEESGPAYIKTFLTVLRNVYSAETTEYVVALIYDLLQANPKRASFFYDESLSNEDIFGPLLRLLTVDSWVVQQMATKVLTMVLVAGPQSGPDAPQSSAADGVRHSSSSSGSSGANGASSSSSSHGVGNGSSQHGSDVVETFVAWLSGQLESPSHPADGVPNAVTALAGVLRLSRARQVFATAGGVPKLVPLVRPVSSQQHMQLLYEAVLCVWLLSFNATAVDAMKHTRVVANLNDVAKSTTKEKIVRVAVLALLNLLQRGHLGGVMVELGLHKTVNNLKLNAWHDEDLTEALDALADGLRHNLKVLSSFDVYRAEVLSGTLDWSPMHKDAAFWRENVMHFEDHDFQVLRVLITLLDAAKDKRTLAVTCHDVGQFIAAHPSGRHVALDMKAKEKVMPLMNDDDAEVRKQALLCIQKLLLSAKYVSYLQA